MNKKVCSVLALVMSIFLTSCSQDEIREFDIPRGEEEHMHAVDLGLSVKWACCNIGAEFPEEYGGYYAWGDPEEKDSCIWTRYKWHNDSTGEMTKYNGKDEKIVLDPSDDIAQIMWGEDWRMPTQAEMHELMECCEWEWTSVNGVYGYKVTSKKNGNSIFLPAAGWKDDSAVNDQNNSGYYWLALPHPNDPNQARSLYFDEERGVGVVNRQCYTGRCLRAVCP